MTTLIDHTVREQPVSRLSAFGPNWYASVMGTGIVAIALNGLPHRPSWGVSVAVVVWLLAAVTLVVVTLATTLHWRRFPDTARGHLRDAAMSPFYGAPAMACLTVGAGALLVGHELIGQTAAVIVDWVLWSIGTALGLFTAAEVPYLQFTKHQLDAPSTFGSWLMPVVPPMVSASTGTLLVAHTPAGEARRDLFFGCYTLFGVTFFAALIIISMLWSRLTYNDPGPARMVPTLWIVLGPLGQSITALHLLANASPLVLAPATAQLIQSLSLFVALPIWGFALLWLAIAATITIKTASTHLPFTLTWWSFTFPVGTMVTGTTGLAARTDSVAVSWIAVALFLFLVTAWATVTVRTLHGTHTRSLFAK